MEAAPINFYAILGPVVLGLVLVEFFYCVVKKNGFYSYQDSLIGIGTMMIAQCVNLAVAGAVVASYGWIYAHAHLFEIPKTWWSFALCYLGVDILFYWFHRAGHRINILWAAHATHHSAEELNYAVALRTSFSQRAASFLFYWPLAVLGFSPDLIVPIVALNLIIQFIPHTRVIPRMPRFIDAWLNTPYHHRIHHAANPIYWDKNYAGTFIVWDKLFGTYEDESEPIYYGITVHPRSWDPTWLNVHWFVVLWNDMRHATHFVDKVQLWFRPPGWRPRNLPAYDKPDPEVARVAPKFQTQALAGAEPYLVFQLVVNMATLFLVIGNRSPLSTIEKVILTALLWAAVTLWAAMLESKPWARPMEALRLCAFAAIVGALLSRHGMAFTWQALVIGSSILSFAWLALAVGRRYHAQHA